MPLTRQKSIKFSPPRELTINYGTFRKGLNIFLRDNEIDPKEMSVADNLMLTGSGIPTKRWGTQMAFIAGPSLTDTSVNMIIPLKSSEEVKEVLTFGSWGYLTKQSGGSYTQISGVSWPTTAEVNATQLGNYAYFVSADREFVKYDFSTAIGFATIASPAGAAVTNISTVTLDIASTYDWRITAVSNSGGETIGSTPVSLSSLPQDLTKAYIRLTWSPVSAASGVLTGYNIYRGRSGDELRWIGGVPNTVTTFNDPGNLPTSTQLVPLSNSTGGIKAKYILRYKDRLILAGIDGKPTRLIVSAPFPNQERFDAYSGGAYVEIEPDSGEFITGLGIHQEKLIVFKEQSVWQIEISTVPIENAEIGEATALNYKLMTGSQGCSSFRSIVAVENDVMFSNREGIYILRYEPQLLNILNANEISAKIKPYFDSLSDYDKTHCVGAYIDKKYWLFFPEAKEAIMFDRERLAFMGKMKYRFGTNDFKTMVDDSGNDRWYMAADNCNKVIEKSKNFSNDDGEAIATFFKSRKEDFSDWTTFKILNEVYTNFSSVVGNVDINIYIEDRAGTTVTTKAFTLTGAATEGTSGLGFDLIGDFIIGDTEGSPTTIDDETITKSLIYKPARTVQVEIRTSGVNDNYKLLGLFFSANAQPRGNSPSSWRK